MQQFDPGFNPHQQQAGLIQNANQSAVLYVFSPRKFDIQQRRSLLYNFNERFVNKAQEALHETSTTNPVPKLNMLTNSLDAVDTVMPDAQGMPLRMDHLSGRWSFLLVVNGEEPQHRMRASGFDDVALSNAMKAQLKSNRVIYYGFFTEEPINPATLNSHAPTINPHARLMITHKTFVNCSSSFGGTGQGTPRFDVLGNADFVDPSMLHMISPDPLYRNTPDKLFETTEIQHDPDLGENFTLNAIGEMSALHQSQPTFAMSSSLSEPRENLRRVMQGVASANDAIFTQANMGPMSGPTFDDLTQLGNQDMFTATLVGQFAQVDMPPIGLSEGEIVTMDHLRARYNPEVVPFIINQSSQWDTMDQTVRSAANVWSSLLLQAAPVLLTNAGLSEISLQYDSPHDMEQIFTFSHMANASDAEKQHAVRAFVISLKTRLFQMMKHARGEFRVMLNLQSAGVSHCTLNFYDDEITNTAPVESPSIAGGLITNMLGTADTTAHNGSELVGFVDAVMGTQGAMDFGVAPQYNNNAQMAQHFEGNPAPVAGPPIPHVPAPAAPSIPRQPDFAPKPFVPNPNR